MIDDETFREFDSFCRRFFGGEFLRGWEWMKAFYLASQGKTNHEITLSFFPESAADDREFRRSVIKVRNVLTHFVNNGYLKKISVGKYVYQYKLTAKGQRALGFIEHFDRVRSGII